ncbi:unnamed protein product [Discula destructiva]
MDRSLDEILAAQQPKSGRGRPRGGPGRGDQQRRREPRNDYPRDGVRKSYRDDAPRNIDTEWVHDRFEDNGYRSRQGYRGQERDLIADHVEEVGTKVRVDNVHYDLTKEDLTGLFSGIGPVLNLEMKYDRAGRSTGSVFVTFEFSEDAHEAVREFDGANAKGQPIHLKVLPPLRRQEAGAGRPLSERATLRSGRNRSRSPARDLEDEAARRNIDRYVPGGRRDRDRSPIRGRGRERGRRPGTGRDRPRGNREGGNEGGERPGRDGRPKKTQEELDAEMEDYFNAQASNGGGQAAAAAPAAAAAAAPVAEEDIDMIE